jgi:beta-glucosidase
MSVLLNEQGVPLLTGAASDFGVNFHWGISTSAYQTEGAYLDDGKGPSIWDDFSNRKGKIADGSSGNEACEFYYRYEQDLHILKELGIKNFRFSISWSRLLPDGFGTVNPHGLAYYERLIDTCLKFEITPWITLYHWDLPLALEKKGGWANREILHWFQQFAHLCASQFGDRVKHWMVLNEPLVFTGAGYFFGIHAPGKKGMSNFLAAAHHAALCQAIGGKVLREVVKDAYIGTTVSCSHVTPHSAQSRHIKAAQKVDALINRFFVEPFLGLGYPLKELKGLNMIEKFVKGNDIDELAFDFDFLGIQSYTREIVKHSMFTPVIRAKLVPAEKRSSPLTAMNWEIYPEGMYHLLQKFSAYKGIKKIIVTENGAAFEDLAEGSIVRDAQRIDYLRKHLAQIRKAKEEGAPVEGYFVWTFLDNFEWAEGYRPRFGLVYVDFRNQQRIIKQSALWYAEYISK